jgi:acyl dehydratase
MPKLADLNIGDEVANRSFHLTRDSLVRYAGASGDFNPIHYSDDVAAAVGLPGVLAHGMLTMGLSIQPVVDWVGGAEHVVDYGVRFTRPVVVDPAAGADLVVSVKVAAIEEETAKVRLDITTTYQDAAVLGKAQAWVQL